MVKNPISILPRVWEKDATAICWLVYIGSLPLAWEKAFVRKRYSTSARNTPTRVGKRILNLLQWKLVWRITPRVWEKEVLNVADRGKLGITPTCVGKSIHRLRALTMSTDHSHVCGKKRRACCALIACKGSLPRVWEKVEIFIDFNNVNRITPTCVGKSS